MSKKLFAAFMTIAAFGAFAVSATSASAVRLTQPTGTALATGTKLLGTNVGNIIMTSNVEPPSNLLECTKATMTWLVDTNSGTVSATISSFSIEGTANESRCTGSGGVPIKYTMGIPGGLPYCVKSLSEDKSEIRGGACTEEPRSIKYTMDLGGSTGTCGYEVAGFTGTLTTDTTGDAIMTVTKAGPFKRFESSGIVGIICPETSTLDMSFTLERDNLSAAEPAYFS